MILCPKCGRNLKETEYYTNKDGSKTELCKKCLTMHIKNDDPETYLWILEKMDVPYVPGEWMSLYNKAYAKDPTKINGLSVFGKYLSKMRLSQFKNKGWADSEQLQEEEAARNAQRAVEQKLVEEELKQQYENGDINEAEYRTLTSTATQQKEDLAARTQMPQEPQSFYNERNYISEDELPDIGAELTQEEKIMLAMKWGREYTPAEWIKLEQCYKDFNDTFSIEDPDTKNTLILICKTTLKMNQSIDSSDFESYNKLSKVYEAMRKSAKFTAVQNKEESKGVVDCVGELVAYCEKYGGQIPRYDTSVDFDVFDKVIRDMKGYTKDLVYGDPALARMIEDYIKRNDALAQSKKLHEEAEAAGEDFVELDDNDYEESFDRVYDEISQDISEQEDK